MRAAAERTFVVMQVRNQASESDSRSRRGGMSLKRREIDLSGRVSVPERRVRPIDKAGVGNDPLTVQGSEAIAQWCDDRFLVVLDRLRTMLVAKQTGDGPFRDSLVSILMRVKQRLLSYGILLADQP